MVVGCESVGADGVVGAEVGWGGVGAAADLALEAGGLGGVRLGEGEREDRVGGGLTIIASCQDQTTVYQGVSEGFKSVCRWVLYLLRGRHCSRSSQRRQGHRRTPG